MVDKITGPITPLDEIDKINEIIDNLGGGVTVDQTYNASSANAQSGVAINGAKFIQNTATGTQSFSIGGTPTTTTGSTNIGYGSHSAANYATALGYNANGGGNSAVAIGGNATASGSHAVAIGRNATTTANGSYAVAIGAGASCSGGKSIQLGYGTNSTPTSLSVGFKNVDNYQLLDGTTGKIPNDRIKYDGTTITVNSNGELTSTGSGGASRNIGEIVTSTIPLTDAGLHLLDGTLISGSGSYSAFVTYIAGLVSTYPSLFITESAWQTAVTTYGVCGKFVYDSISNTVRLPKVTGIIEGTTDLTALGDLVKESLPNHTHNYTDYYAVFEQGHGGSYPLVSSSNTSTIRTSEGSNNSVYKDNAHVQPQTIKVLYYIVIATSTKTDIQSDIDEIATDLNGKADVDLTNTTPAISFATAMDNAGIRTVVETYQNGTSWYRVYSDGWCEQGGVYSFTGVHGGTYSINLLKSLSNTNYTVLRGGTFSIGVSALVEASVISKATDSFSIQYVSQNGASYAVDYYWQACGYIS